MLVHEDYRDYTLTARWDPHMKYLQGIVSGRPDVPTPNIRILSKFHGLWYSIWEYPTELLRAEIPKHHWAYRFICNEEGDVAIVNGEIVSDRSTPTIRREWTMESVLQHLKDCIDS